MKGSRAGNARPYSEIQTAGDTVGAIIIAKAKKDLPKGRVPIRQHPLQKRTFYPILQKTDRVGDSLTLSVFLVLEQKSFVFEVLRSYAA